MIFVKKLNQVGFCFFAQPFCHKEFCRYMLFCWKLLKGYMVRKVGNHLSTVYILIFILF